MTRDSNSPSLQPKSWKTLSTLKLNMWPKVPERKMAESVILTGLMTELDQLKIHSGPLCKGGPLKHQGEKGPNFLTLKLWLD